MTDPQAADADVLAQRLAALRSRSPAGASAPPVPPPAGRRRSGRRRRRHVAVGSRRTATGVAAAGTLGLVAGMALAASHAAATVPTPTPVVTGPSVATTGGASATSGSSTLLPGGRGQPATSATPSPPAGSTSGSTHGSS